MNDPWVLTCVLGLIGGMVVYTLGVYSDWRVRRDRAAEQAAEQAAREAGREMFETMRSMHRMGVELARAEARLPLGLPPPAERQPWQDASTVREIMAGVRADKAYDRLPVLADALEDAGCDDQGLLVGLRTGSPVAREWAEKNL